MEDRKRETAVSMLPIIPEDSDSGRTYTCRVVNPAAPAGRQTSVTINVQRESSIHLPTNTLKLSTCSMQSPVFCGDQWMLLQSHACQWHECFCFSQTPLQWLCQSSLRLYQREPRFSSSALPQPILKSLDTGICLFCVHSKPLRCTET